jgi:polyisoprenoid-binding protein YceI
VKKVIVFILGLISLYACNGKKTVETTESKKVETVKTDSTSVYRVLDTSSVIHWRAAHLGWIKERYGDVYLKSAEVLVNGGKITNATFVVDMPSITVKSIKDEKSRMKLQNHLKSADFFDVENYPVSKFEITGIEPATEGEYNSKITGNLTVKDVSKSIAFNANVQVSEDWVRIQSGDFAVNRQDWGISYNSEGTPGIPRDFLIDDRVVFKVDVKVKK